MRGFQAPPPPGSDSPGIEKGCCGKGRDAPGSCGDGAAKGSGSVPPAPNRPGSAAAGAAERAGASAASGLGRGVVEGAGAGAGKGGGGSPRASGSRCFLRTTSWSEVLQRDTNRARLRAYMSCGGGCAGEVCVEGRGCMEG